MKSFSKRLLVAGLIPVIAIAFLAAAIVPKSVKADSVSKVADKFTVGSWVSFYPESVNDISYQTEELAKSGMNYLLLPAFCSVGGNWGLPSFVNDRSSFYSTFDSVAKSNNVYYNFECNNPSNYSEAISEAAELENCVGYHIKDEPSYSTLKTYADLAKNYKAGDPARTPFLNLFPSYAGSGLLGGTFKNYVSTWVELAGKENLEFLYYDNYPFMKEGGIRSSYFSDMEIVRSVASVNGLKAGGFTQMGSYNGMRRPTVAEARWSMNSYVAYGFKSISHFNWVAPQYIPESSGGEAFGDFVLTTYGEKTDLYEPMSILNWQTRQLGDVLMNLEVSHAYHAGDIPEGVEVLPSSFEVRPENSSDDFIISLAFSKDNGEPYLMIFDKRLEGERKDYSFKVDSSSGIDSVRYYAPDDYTMETLPDPKDLSTLTAPTERVINVADGNLSLSFIPGEVKVLKLESKTEVHIRGALGAPECSHESGVYSGVQNIVLTPADSGVDIYYTLDGSYPTVGSDSTFLYSAPITVGENGLNEVANIRAIEVSGDKIGELKQIRIATVNSVAENLTADTSGWQNIGDATFTNDGTTIKNTDEYQTSNWDKGYVYSSKKLKNFVVSGSMSLDVSWATGFAGFSFYAKTVDATFTKTARDFDSVLFAGLYVNGTAVISNGKEILASGRVIGFNTNEEFTYSLFCCGGEISFKINGEVVVSYSSNALKGADGYFGIYSGTMPVSVYSVSLQTFDDNAEFGSYGERFYPISGGKIAVNAGTDLSAVISEIGSTAKVRSESGVDYDINVSWSCDDYDGLSKGSSFTLIGVYDAGQLGDFGLVSVVPQTAKAYVYIKTDVDYSNIDYYINLGNSLDKDDYVRGSAGVSGTYEYFAGLLDSAKGMREDPFLMQSDIQVGAMKLEEAIYALRYIGDQSALDTAIARAQALDSADYLPSSFADYEEKINNARALRNRTFKTAYEIENAVSELNDVSGLVKISDGLDFAMTKGASVRYIEPFGIRFKASFSESKYKSLLSDGYTINIGMLIAPADYAGLYGELTVDNTLYPKGVNVPCSVDKLIFENGTAYYTCALVNILEQNLTRRFNAVAYMTIEKDGIVSVVYAHRDDNSRSIYEVSALVLNSGTEELSEVKTEKINGTLQRVENVFDFSCGQEYADVGLHDGVSLKNIYIPEVYYDRIAGEIFVVKNVYGYLGETAEKIVVGKNVVSVNVAADKELTYYFGDDNGGFGITTETTSAIAGGQKTVFVDKGATTAVLPLLVGGEKIIGATFNGESVSATVSEGYAVIILNNAEPVYGINRATVSLSGGGVYEFAVCYGVKDGETEFSDFGVNVFGDGLVDGYDGLAENRVGNENTILYEFNLTGGEYVFSFDAKLPFGDASSYIQIIDNNGTENIALAAITAEGGCLSYDSVIPSSLSSVTVADGWKRFSIYFADSSAKKLFVIIAGNASGFEYNLVIDNIRLIHANPDTKRIALIGDFTAGYADELKNVCGDAYLVWGYTALGKAVESAELSQTLYKALSDFKPDYIIFSLGTLDAAYENGVEEAGELAFINNYSDILSSLKGYCGKLIAGISPSMSGDVGGLHADELNSAITGMQGYAAYAAGVDIADFGSLVYSGSAYDNELLNLTQNAKNVIAEKAYLAIQGEKPVNRYALSYAVYSCIDKTQAACVAAINALGGDLSDAELENLLSDIQPFMVIKDEAVYDNVINLAYDAEVLCLGLNSGNVHNADTFTLKVNGSYVDAEYLKNNRSIIFGKDVIDVLYAGINDITLISSSNAEYSFTVMLGTNENNPAFYDFDGNSCSIEKVGVDYSFADGVIDNRSLRVQTSGSGEKIFAFAKEDGDLAAYGFPIYNFKTSTDYKLSFDIKTGPNCSSDWWGPVSLGSYADIVYVRQYSGLIVASTPNYNLLNSVASSEDLGNGVYRVSVIFTSLSSNSNNEISFVSWSGTCDLYLDNVLLTEIGDNSMLSGKTASEIVKGDRFNVNLAVKNTAVKAVKVNGTEVSDYTLNSRSVSFGAVSASLINVGDNSVVITDAYGKTFSFNVRATEPEEPVVPVQSVKVLQNFDWENYFNVSLYTAYDETDKAHYPGNTADHHTEGDAAMKMTSIANWQMILINLKVDGNVLTAEELDKIESISIDIYAEMPQGLAGTDFFYFNHNMGWLVSGANTLTITGEEFKAQMTGSANGVAAYNSDTGWAYFQIAKAGITLYFDNCVATYK